MWFNFVTSQKIYRRHKPYEKIKNILYFGTQLRTRGVSGKSLGRGSTLPTTGLLRNANKISQAKEPQSAAHVRTEK